DYAGASLDRKSTTGSCQFLGKRLISWQCKKQTIVANSTTEAEYVAAANCYGQVLWIQNQMLDYGFNFMNTKIYIDNKSTICIVKNPVFHSKTKNIEIRHYFIKDSYEKRLIQVIKIHTDHNVADLLTKAFDVSSIRDKFGNKTGSCKSRMDERTCNIKQKCVKSQIPKRGRDTKIPQSGGPPEKVGDEAVHKELGDRMERAATTASSLEAEQDSGSGPRCQDTILDTGQGSGNINKTPSMPYDSPLLRGHTLRSDEGRMQQHELMDLVIKLSDRFSPGSVGVSTASRLFSTAEESVSTAGASMPVSTAGTVQEVNKDKGKGIMIESEPEQTKTKLQQRQERAVLGNIL
ncbi:hypothetical protein Tco_1159287, partial [Tanacetum coccineum]